MSPSPLHTSMPMPPKGATPNAPVTLGIPVIIVVVVLSFFSLASCAVRAMVRRRTTQQLRWDEYMVIVSVLMTIGSLIFTLLTATTLKSSVTALHYHYTATPFTTLSTATSQAASALYLHRTLAHRRPWKVLLAAIVVLIAAINLLFVLLTNVQCTPLAMMWDAQVMGSCVEGAVAVNIAYLHGALVGVVFCYVGVYLISAVWLVDVPRTERVPYYVVAAFNFACLALIGIWIFNTSLVGARPALSNTLLLTIIFSITIQNLSLFTTNMLPIITLFRLSSSSPSPSPSFDPTYDYDLNAAPVNLEKTPEVTISPAIALRSNALIAPLIQQQQQQKTSKLTLAVPKTSLAPLSPIVETPDDNDGEGIVKRVSVRVTEEEVKGKDQEVMERGDVEWAKVINGGDSRAFIGVAQ